MAACDPLDLAIPTLGTCQIASPMKALLDGRQTSQHYVGEHDRVLFDDTASMVAARGGTLADLPGFEPAGARQKIYFDPAKTRVGIVTCGGLCPGLNNVIRGLVMELWFHYGVRKIYGFTGGFRGFIPEHGQSVIDLTPETVSNIHDDGGTILGTSRGRQESDQIVDCLDRMGISILFVIGGDGSLRGAMKISEIVASRNEKISVIGIPKTIDNDIPFIDQSFGFQTAFSEAVEAISSAHVEAKAAPHGVGLVKLMGRHSGFIACYAALARNDANYVLIPEVPFAIDGPGGFLEHLLTRVRTRGHAVVVLAEGAGQDECSAGPKKTDASGNVLLGDIGVYLKDRIKARFQEANCELNMKYIDPSYLIRSVKANPFDAVYCLRLAHNAVHAAMAGRTSMVVARWHGRFVHIPMAMAVSKRNQVDPNGDLWLSVLEATGQPRQFHPSAAAASNPCGPSSQQPVGR